MKKITNFIIEDKALSILQCGLWAIPFTYFGCCGITTPIMPLFIGFIVTELLWITMYAVVYAKFATEAHFARIKHISKKSLICVVFSLTLLMTLFTLHYFWQMEIGVFIWFGFAISFYSIVLFLELIVSMIVSNFKCEEIE